MRIERCFLGLAVVGLLATATPAFAGDDDGAKTRVKLPRAVKKTVKAMFPKAKIQGTSMEKDDEGETLYEVELLVKGKTVDLLIDEEGEIEEIEREISLADLPRAVTTAVLKAYPRAEIEKVEEVTGEDDKVLYELLVETRDDKMVEVLVVPNGKILKSEAADDDGDDEAMDDDDDKPKAKGKKTDKDDDKGMEDDDGEPRSKKTGKGEDDDDDQDD